MFSIEKVNGEEGLTETAIETGQPIIVIGSPLLPKLKNIMESNIENRGCPNEIIIS